MTMIQHVYLFCLSYGGQDFSVVFDPLSKAGLKSPEQIELEQLREENA